MEQSKSLAFKSLTLFAILVLNLGDGAAFAADEVRFNRDVLPILSDACFACHGPDEHTRKASLRLDEREMATGPAESGKVAIVPGQPEASELIRRVFASPAEGQMPPPEAHKTLTAADRELLRLWVAQGAEYEPHWAYSALERPMAPPPVDEKSAKSPIDRFIAARLDEEGAAPVPTGDRVTLVRRLSFDLTGLPPTPAEVDRFLNDQGEHAYVNLVNRLLNSPRFGERMAVYWLDLVRYADTVGYHGDQNVSQYPYRDYVIDAFNANKPYDQFVREQLAGDLLRDATIEQQIASGYNRLNQTTEEGGAQAKEYLAIYFADRVRNVSQVFMGATMGCAQCHDHKFDPYTIRDFYSFGAFFADLEERGVYGARSRPPQLRLPTPEQEDKLADLDRQLDDVKEEIESFKKREADTSKELKPLEEKLKSLQAQRNAVEETVRRTVVSKSVEPRTIRILARGNWMDDSGEVVESAIPAFLGELDTGDRRATRLDLANWLTEPDNPLTARTFVNRVWYLLFGRGICASVDDFGRQGTFPSHPDLLDWLAVEFVESGWDIKHLIRTIVMSSAYQRSSLPSDELRQRDPFNKLFARQGRFRIPAEMVRDTALATSGLLVEKMGGPSTRPYQPAGYYRELNFPRRTYQADSGEDQYRRGVYTHWQRTFLHPMLKAFDAPSREECTAARARSNTPLQALVLLNDPTFVEAARVFAARIMREGGDTLDDRIDWAYRTAVSRDPGLANADELRQIFEKHHAHYRANRAAAKQLIAEGNAPVETDLDPAELAAWTSISRIILNLHETITRY